MVDALGPDAMKDVA